MGRLCGPAAAAWNCDWGCGGRCLGCLEDEDEEGGGCGGGMRRIPFLGSGGAGGLAGTPGGM